MTATLPTTPRTIMTETYTIKPTRADNPNGIQGVYNSNGLAVHLGSKADCEAYCRRMNLQVVEE